MSPVSIAARAALTSSDGRNSPAISRFDQLLQQFRKLLNRGIRAVLAASRLSVPDPNSVSDCQSCTHRDPPIQMADMPPSTDKSTPFTKLESSEARNTAAVAISSGRPIFPRGIRDSNIRFPSSSRTWSCIGVAIGPGLSTFTRIFLPFSSLSHVRANERNAALLAEYTPKPGKPFTEATDPVRKIDPPSLNSGNAF